MFSEGIERELRHEIISRYQELHLNLLAFILFCILFYFYFILFLYKLINNMISAIIFFRT